MLTLQVKILVKVQLNFNILRIITGLSRPKGTE